MESTESGGRALKVALVSLAAIAGVAGLTIFGEYQAHKGRERAETDARRRSVATPPAVSSATPLNTQRSATVGALESSLGGTEGRTELPPPPSEGLPPYAAAGMRMPGP
jgi:hypothetical protein